jgi:aspartate aminotransferase-like enzyme
MPEGFNEADLRAVILRHFNMSLGAGLGKLAGKVFRIGHLGSFNDLMLAGTLCGVEMGLNWRACRIANRAAWRQRACLAGAAMEWLIAAT